MNFLPHLFRKGASGQNNAEVSMLKGMLRVCSICGSTDFAGHTYAQVASAIVEDQSQTRLFLEMGEKGEWTELHRLSSWDSTRDNLRWLAVRCGTGTTHVVTFVDPFEFFASECVLVERPVIRDEELAELNQAISGTPWNSLSGQP